MSIPAAILRVIADSLTWLGFIRHESYIVWALLRRKIRLKGSPKLLLAFGKCFPQ
jgi:hypothetical protein